MATIKNLNWLEEVKMDAEYNYMRHLREQQEREKHEEEKLALAKKLAAQRAEQKKGK